jgi:transcriptional regulator with XRE-family HTH domain
MNSKNHCQVGHRICVMQKRRRLTQEELAAKLAVLHVPVTRNIIANWETSRSVVPAHWIPFLVRALRAKVIDLLPSLAANDLRIVKT